MSQTAVKYIHNHAVLYDPDYPHRWIDVFGPNVVKTFFDAAQYNNAMYTETAVNASTIAGAASLDGGPLVFTAGGADNDGIQAQQEAEQYYPGHLNYPFYFGCRVKWNDITQSDALLGFFITDTTAIDGGTDGIYFRQVDASAVVSFVLEKDSVENANTVNTGADDTYYTYEFLAPGDGYIYYYLNGVEIGSIANTNASYPNDEHLAFIMAYLSGEGVANTMHVLWARAFQIYE